MEIDVTVKGLGEAQKRAIRVVQDIRGTPLLNAVRDSMLLVTRDAKINAPVDTGRLRASITPEIRQGKSIDGIVGSNVEYAPYQELGTRFIKPRRYLQRALEDNQERIFALISKTVDRIIARK